MKYRNIQKAGTCLETPYSASGMGNTNVCCNKDDGPIKTVIIEDSSDSKNTYGQLPDDAAMFFTETKLAFAPSALSMIAGAPRDSPVTYKEIPCVDGGYYTGQIVNGKRQGPGMQTFADGSVYMGEWNQNLPHGRGQMDYKEERRQYTGEFKRGRCDGYGVGVSIKDGYTIYYMGEYKNDFANGSGEEFWDDGSRYAGQFKDGQKHGYGVYYWADGGIYKGTWVHNDIEGFGHYYGAQGRVFMGEWRGSIKHGYGSHFWDGQLYDGRYEDDRKAGFGVFTWTDKKMYVGYWADGSQDGPGVVADAQDRQKLTLWNKGVRVVSKDHPASFKAFENDYKQIEDVMKDKIKALRAEALATTENYNRELNQTA